MMFFPYEDYKIVTNLTYKEIYQKFIQEIEPKESIHFWINDEDKYKGAIDGKSFQLNRIIGLNKDMKVIINGKIEEYEDETIIFIKMRMSIFMIIFSVIWLGGVVISGISTLIKQIKGNAINSDILIALFMFIFGYCFITLLFKLESSRNKKYLKWLFSGNPNQ